MKLSKRLWLWLVLALFFSAQTIRTAYADAGDCFYTPPDTVTCTTGGSGTNGGRSGSGSGGSSGGGGGASCTEISPTDFSNVLIPSEYFSYLGASAPPGSCLPARGRFWRPTQPGCQLTVPPNMLNHPIPARLN